MATTRTTVDISAYPDLVVIYLGMKALNVEGARTFHNFGPGIEEAVAAQPDGLLFHEYLTFTMEPLPHAILRQYWRDFVSLETWARTMPHMQWWQDFLRDPQGTHFWHETYFLRGGMEAIYGNVQEPLGLLGFAPSHPARGAMFSARQRLGLEGEPASVASVEGVEETGLYPGTP